MQRHLHRSARLARLALLAVVVAGVTPSRADAPPAPPTSPTPPSPSWSLGFAGGIDVFVNSRSLALPHRYDPVARAHALYALDERLELGVEAVATLGDHRQYRLIGGYLLGRATLASSATLRFDLRFGVGAGTGPRILAAELDVARPAAVWTQLGLELGWRFAGPHTLRVALIGEHLSVLGLVLGVDLRL